MEKFSNPKFLKSINIEKKLFTFWPSKIVKQEILKFSMENF